MIARLFVIIVIGGFLLHSSPAFPIQFTQNNPYNEFFKTLEQGIEHIETGTLDSAEYILNLASNILVSFERHEEYYDSAHIALADAYFELAERYRRARDFSSAKEYHTKALDIRSPFLDAGHPAIGDSYYYLAIVHFVLGEYQPGLDRIQRSLTVRKKAYGALHEKVADSYNLTGTFHSIMDEYNEAQSFYEKALSIRVELLGEKHSDVASSYNNLGIVARQRGDTDAALEYYYRAVAIRLAVDGKEHLSTAQNYMNIGNVYATKKMYEEAIDYSERALGIQLAALGENHHGVALNLNNLGVIYREFGEHKKALEYLNRSLDIRRHLFGDVHPAIAQSLNNIGALYKKTGEYEAALAYLVEALEMRKEIFGNHNTHIADTYVYIGNIYRSMQQYDYALNNYRNAVAALAPDFVSIGRHIDDLSIFDNAIINRSLLIVLSEKSAMYHRMYADTPGVYDPLYAAVPVYRTAKYVGDLLRSTFTDEQSKLLLSEFSSEIFENAVNTLFMLSEATGDRHYIHEAFSFAEHSRALLLWESMVDSRARSFAGIPDSVLDRERELHRNLIQTRLQYHRTQSGTDEFTLIRSEYFDALREYQSFTAALESDYPRYFSLKHDISAPSLTDVQNILDDDTVLLQYLLGDKQSFLFVITSRDYTLLPVDNSRSITDETFYLRSAIHRLDMNQFIDIAAGLYAALIEPAHSFIENINRLIIIPDGILHHLPFEALITETGSLADASSLSYLIHDYEISYHYSSKLALYKAEEGRHRITDASDIRFGGFAPVFTSVLENFHATHQDTDPETDRQRSVSAGLSLEWFSDLPYSELEVNEIGRLFRMINTQSDEFYHFDATKKQFLHNTDRYSHIHVASHGFFNEDEPMLSGVLFSPAYNSDIDESRDVLFAGEIYTLNLNSDLLVLSSCESGIGTIARGEGILALTRGFIHAGAYNLLVSLWKVTDRHTADLMREFYRHLIEGESYAAALRNAKLYMIEKDTSSMPVFWSGFVLVGM